MKIDAPRQAVLATAELIENILEFVNCTTLLVSQRVSRQFRDIVATSTTLQHKLLFRNPDHGDNVRWALLDGPRPPDPASRKFSPSRIDVTEVQHLRVAASREGRPYVFQLATALNPLFREQWRGTCSEGSFTGSSQLTGQKLTFRRGRLTMLGPGSWRAMHL